MSSQTNCVDKEILPASFVHKASYYADFSEEELKMAESYLIHEDVPKNTFILSPGQKCNHVYFLQKGLIRYYTTNEDKEIILQFFSEGDFFSDYHSFLKRQASILYIESIEDCIIIKLHWSNLQALYQMSSRFEKFGRKIAEELYLKLTERIISNMCDKPEEKLTNLNKKYPLLVKRIPQYMLSAYLGLTPEAYCRIKKRCIMKGELN